VIYPFGQLELVVQYESKDHSAAGRRSPEPRQTARRSWPNR
jgi:hypothetical protein